MNVLKEQMEINIADHMERCEHIEKNGKILKESTLIFFSRIFKNQFCDD